MEDDNFFWKEEKEDMFSIYLPTWFYWAVGAAIIAATGAAATINDKGIRQIPTQKIENHYVPRQQKQIPIYHPEFFQYTR